MTPELSETAQLTTLLLDLVRLIVDHPGEVQIVRQEAETGDCYWAIKGHPEDEAKLIGRGASHIRALQLLVAYLGRVRDRSYTCRLLTERQPGNRGVLVQRDALKYDPEPVRLVLARLIAALEIPHATIAVGPGGGPPLSLTFVFRIVVLDVDYFRALTVPLEDAPALGDEEPVLIGAIGTLFRAIAKRAGVRFSIVVDQQ